MDVSKKGRSRSQLSRKMAEKMEVIAELRSDMENKKKSIGTSVDDQITIAEMEYRLVKEEMALLSLQEQHWELAAKWDAQSHDIQKELCDVLYNYITSVKEKGSIPVLHVSEHLTPENSILISSQSDKPSIPKVEWAHNSTDLQLGDRLLEVNGQLVIGKDSSEVTKILSSSRPVCRLVFLRPVSLYQMVKSHNGCKETSNLRHELTTVVSRLNLKMAENGRLHEHNARLQKNCEELKNQNSKLKLQVLSLQSILLCLYQSVENNNFDNTHSQLLSESPTIFDVLRKISVDESCPLLCSGALKDLLETKKKSIPWLELSTSDDICKQSENSSHEESDTHNR